jgi:septum formation protein
MKLTTLPLILASGSPRRQALLAELGHPFRVIVSDAPEHTVPGLDAEAQAITLAERKARTVAANFTNGLILGADTIVVWDGELLGKPVGDAEAASMLRRLSGREHQVITGIALVDAATGSVSRGAVGSSVRFRGLTEGEIAAYVATGEPRDKAGAYAIQGLGSAFISGFDGCYTNIVGLPLCEVAAMLNAAGVVIPATSSGCALPDGRHCPRRV